MKHSPEPWKVLESHPGKVIADSHNQFVADKVMNGDDYGEADAKRIVDCVNALTGIENPVKMRQTWDIVKELELDAYHKLKEEHDNFIELVREMRSHQKEYFKNRTRSSLEKSKELERTIDLVLLPTDKTIKQPKLFE